MALSSILSSALVQVILFSRVISATSGDTISVQFSKSLAVNSTDDYLIPLTIGTPPQTIYLNPSINTDDLFGISPKACTPTGNATALASCTKYRGGVFSSKGSSSYTATGDTFTWKDDQYILFANGTQGKDTVVLLDGEDDISMEGFQFGLIDACNMTSGFVGLGPNSALLGRLVKDRLVGSRSYGIHVGVDIENHSSGAGKFKRGASNVTSTAGDMQSYPGCLTFGGYDKTKIDSRVGSLKAPTTSDGVVELELKSLVLNQGAVGDLSHDIFNGTRKLIIDSSTPYIYLPKSTAKLLSDALGANYGGSLVDFYYGVSADRYIGNITFTLQVPGGGDSIGIEIPSSVLYQKITALRDYVPAGNDIYDHYLPVKTFDDSSKQPIVLGRTFLKAAYLFVNHDSGSFELSQVSYTNEKPDIVAVGASGNGSKNGNFDAMNEDADSSSDKKKGPPIILIAVIAGAAGVFFALGIVFILWRRKQSGSTNPPQSALQSIPSSSTVNDSNSRGNELDHNGSSGMTNISLRDPDEKHPLGPGYHGGQGWGVWEQQTDGSGGYYTPHPLAPGGTHYNEVESDYVGMATSPSQAYPPQWVELPTSPLPVHPALSQHPAFSEHPIHSQHPAFLSQSTDSGPHSQPYQPGPEMRYEVV